MKNEEIGKCKIIGEEIVEKLGTTPLHLYGLGVAADIVLSRYGSNLNVVGYVDNRLAGSDYNGKKIVDGKSIIRRKRSKEKILITTFYRSVEIADDLMRRGLTPGEDFYIFDFYDSLYIDENIRDLIKLNKSIFPVKKRSSESSVLVTFWMAGDATSVVYAYVSNYLAEKYNSVIKAYVRDGATKETVAKSLYDIYESFGTNEIFDTRLSVEQEAETERLYNEIVPTICTMEDWHKITIYGVNVGPCFVQSYFRFSPKISADYDDTWMQYIRNGIRASVFWHDYFLNNDVKCVITANHGNRDGFIRDYACSMGIPTYAIHYIEGRKMTVGYSHTVNNSWFKYFKQFWEMLSDEEKEIGINFAKEELEKRLSGKVAYGVPNSPFANDSKDSVLLKNDRIKVMICPHIFDEEAMHLGWQIFGDYISWLNHLAELSKQTEYDWYIKIHPREGRRGRGLIMDYCAKYPQIKLLPDDISPIQLAREGIRFAFTVGGSIGHEYPLLGIQVINAGNNPHIAFNFNWNPKTKEEFDDLVLNLESKNLSIDILDIYKFYCINFLYYKRMGSDFYRRVFRNNETVELSADKRSTKSIRLFLDGWTVETDKKIRESIENAFEEMDSFDEKRFYRKDLDNNL